MQELRDSDRILVKRDEAARRLSISVRKLDELLATGRIRAVRIDRAVRIPQSELDRIAGDAA